MTIISPYFFNGAAKTCAGCGQPFVIRAGQSEAIVGEDGHLYCYATACEQNAVAPRKLGPALRIATVRSINQPIVRSRARVRFGGATRQRFRSAGLRAAAS
jgi:hypothetical protein